MSARNELDIYALRQIGWDHWDPIGIRQFDDLAWRNNAADEYDAYLLEAANMILRGATVGAVAAYLNAIVSDHMELGPVSAARYQASLRTVEAISAYVLDNRSDS